MKNIILIISLTINILVFSLFGYFGYQGYSATKHSLSSTSSGKILEVIDVNDSGYKSLHYIIDYKGTKVVANAHAGLPKKAPGDVVTIMDAKISVMGINQVTYSIKN